MNGISLTHSNLSPFVLNVSKDSERVFQRPAIYRLFAECPLDLGDSPLDMLSKVRRGGNHFR